MFIPWIFCFLSQKLDAGNQLALINDLHRDIRMVGNEASGEHVPGFCIAKKVVNLWVQLAAGDFDSTRFPLVNLCF